MPALKKVPPKQSKAVAAKPSAKVAEKAAKPAKKVVAARSASPVKPAPAKKPTRSLKSPAAANRTVSARTAKAPPKPAPKTAEKTPLKTAPKAISKPVQKSAQKPALKQAGKAASVPAKAAAPKSLKAQGSQVKPKSAAKAGSQPVAAPRKALVSAAAKTFTKSKVAKTAALANGSDATPTVWDAPPTLATSHAISHHAMKHPHDDMPLGADQGLHDDESLDEASALPADIALIDKELNMLSGDDSQTTGSLTNEHEDLHDPDSDPDFDSGDFSLEDDFDFGDLEAPGPDTCQFTEHDLALALRDFQMDMQGPSGAAEKLDHAKKAHLPGLKGASGKRKKPVTETPSITADDFEEGHQRDAFIIIQEFYRVLLNSDSKVNSRLKAVEFFFCPATPQRINFDEAAVAIDPNIRPDVFRLRLMFEFWNRWTMFGRELPEDALPPPDRVMSMANFHGPAAVALVTECWYYPGIAEHELMERAENYLDQNHESHEKVHLQREFNNLTSNYILSVKSNSVYCTGKNPVMEVNDSMRQSGRLSGARAAQTSWAKLF